MGVLCCPICGSTAYKEISAGTYKCKSCRNVFQDPNYKAPTPSSGGFSPQGHKLDGSQIYDIGIKGTVILTCLDFGTTGSGFIVDVGKRYVITNCHVVSGENGATTKNLICSINGYDVRAGVVAKGDVETLDIALVEIEDIPPGCGALRVADSDKVKRGEGCYAIGNSKGDGLCIKKGIVSDLNRQVGGQRLMMCDVATNPGNSGGPLLNEDGKVIAICVSGRTDAVGMNYFIPTRTIASSLVEYLKVNLE